MFHLAMVVSVEMYRFIMTISIGWYATCSIIYMKHKPKIQNIVHILIKSRFYFDLTLRERLDFIQDILRKHPSSIRRPMFFREKDLVLRSEW
jgi:hypothetical protein